MSVQVAFVCIEPSKMWVRDVAEWSKPLPRLDETVLIAVEDYVADMGNEPTVMQVCWPMNPLSRYDVCIVIGSPFVVGQETEREEWLMKRGFQPLPTAADVEAYNGIPGLEALLPNY